MKKLNAFLLMLCLLGTVSLVAQQTISGKVTDVSGEPIPGASVLVQGTTNGVAADFDGNFTIRAFQGEVLVFSSIAFVSKKVIISKGASYNVSLEEDAQMLQEVVVIGYGSSTKKDLVSSVASIKSDVLENQPVARLDQALQGRAAGVEVTANNGSPGSGSTIRIRGNSSINGNNNPLYVVDGFIAGTDFNLNTININDIKSVEILKDATALSIYGTRGASGVILITTKNGTEMAPGKPKFTINHYSSLQETANQVEVLGGQDYVDYINESGQFVAGASGFGETDTSLSLTYVGEIETTDWLDLVSQTGFISNTDVSVSGNSESSNYYVSLNYFDQKGIVRGSGLERVNFRTNLDVKVSDKFKMGVRFNASNYRIENNKVNYSGIVSSVLPIRTIYDDDGNFTGTNPISSSAQRNPEADIQLRVDHDIVTKLISNAYLEYELFKNFKLKSTFGAELTYIKENNYLPGILPEIVTGGFGRINTNHARSFLNENTFTYDVGIKDHYLKFLGGFTWQKNNSESIRTEADGFPNDATSFNNLESGNPDTFFVDSAFSQRTLASFLGRVNYSYNSKYLLTLVGRYDGSSVFETGNKYAFFPSVGVAWNVDEESFLKESNTIDQLKLRASYGIVGEQGVDPYNSISRYNNTTTSFNETIFNGIQVGDVSSDGLVWETTKQLDLGLEVGFLNNRVSLEADYYKKTTEDLLLAKALSAQAGGGTQLQNVGSVQNSGVELALNTINVEHKNFRWETSVTVSKNESKVLELDGRDFIEIQSTGNQGGGSARLIVGEAFPSFVGVTYLGTYKNEQEIIDDGRVGRSFIGGPRFEDVNGDTEWNDEDNKILGSPQPDFYGSIRNTFTYKDISLDVFFHGSYGAEIFNITSQTSFYGRGDQNVDPLVLDRWIAGVNETSDIPRAGTSTSLFNPNSTVNIEDGSFLRLKTLSLSYNIPLEKVKLDHIFNGLNIYATGTNLLLFSDFKLGDPEVNNFTSGSTNNSFGGVSQGFASGAYPYAKSVTIGVKMDF